MGKGQQQSLLSEFGLWNWHKNSKEQSWDLAWILVYCQDLCVKTPCLFANLSYPAYLLKKQLSHYVHAER